MLMDAWQRKCYGRSTKLTAPCSLCNDGQVRINSISTMNITSQWATYDIGRLNQVNFVLNVVRDYLDRTKVSFYYVKINRNSIDVIMLSIT